MFGVSVKDLKDGWLDCELVIMEFEREYKVLVIRVKKDGVVRMVWLDDLSLFYEVELDLVRVWSRVELLVLDVIV